MVNTEKQKTEVEGSEELCEHWAICVKRHELMEPKKLLQESRSRRHSTIELSHIDRHTASTLS